MKLSLTSSVLLYAAAVHAFPQASTNTTTTRSKWFTFHVPTDLPAPVPQTTEPLKARTEYSVPATSPTNGADVAAKLSGLIQAAEISGDDWEEKQKVLKGLEESRKGVTERLLQAQTKQQSVEAHLKVEIQRLDKANKKVIKEEQDIDRLKNEEVELVKRLKATEVHLSEAEKSQSQVKQQCLTAIDAQKDAADEVKGLLETIEKIDEAIKSIGVPED